MHIPCTCTLCITLYTPCTSSTSREPHCVALYSFDAAGPGELSIKTGDVIMLVEKVDADWIKGRLGGQEGMFPSGFVEVKVDLPPKTKATPAPPASSKAGNGGTHIALLHAGCTCTWGLYGCTYCLLYITSYVYMRKNL